jgi:dephospho-CoA kinase
MAVVIGVTGSIGSGKSTVVRIFGELGAETASADEIARDVLAAGQPAAREVVEVFGREIVGPGGDIDRRKLADRIFADQEARHELDNITHPRIIARLDEIIKDFRKRRRAQQDAVLAVEIPLLFECGLEDTVDTVLVTAAEQETLLNRLMSRSKLSREAALSRLSAQLPLSEKIESADCVIWTDRGLERTREDVRRIYMRIVGQ